MVLIRVPEYFERAERDRLANSPEELPNTLKMRVGSRPLTTTLCPLQQDA
jgi:hypothetical protein